MDLMEQAWVQRGWQRRMFVHVGILRYVVLVLQKFSPSLNSQHDITQETHLQIHTHATHTFVHIPRKVQSLIVLFLKSAERKIKKNARTKERAHHKK